MADKPPTEPKPPKPPKPLDMSGGKVKVGPVNAPIIPLVLIGMGMYLAWFGVHYWRSDMKWPTDPVKSVLQGNGLPSAATPSVSANAQLTADVQALQPDTNANPPSTGTGSTGGTGGTAGSVSALTNQNTAKLLAAPYGWSTGTEWTDLVQLWTKESGWDNHAENPSSHAYGIPQALPYTKMPQPAWPPSAGGQADPTTQINWGLQYIQQRYGSPSAAWAHEVANNWY